MAGYARGKHAKGQCQRCGFVFKLDALIPDGETNLLVCNDCYDIPHPAEEPFDASDAIALARPAPDLDRAASTVVPTQLVDAFGFVDGTYFGGGT